MYGCESWTVKKTECWRIDAFELWCWRRLLRVPWTARRSNQSILKEISPGCSLEVLMLKMKLQYFATWCEALTHLKRPWSWERLRAGREGDDRRWDGWMASLTQWTWVCVDSRGWWWTGSPGVVWFMGSQSRTLLSDSTYWIANLLSSSWGQKFKWIIADLWRSAFQKGLKSSSVLILETLGKNLFLTFSSLQKQSAFFGL